MAIATQAPISSRTTTRVKGVVEVENISVAFERQGRAIEVLKSASFRVHPGEFVCLLGPSGCGKSTILNLLAGFLKPTEGTVSVDGQT
ncbi:MAG: ATP-binding cassette domain-containing protein, partial [Cyanobacteria bacterium P01_D01_bin.123]